MYNKLLAASRGSHCPSVDIISHAQHNADVIFSIFRSLPMSVFSPETFIRLFYLTIAVD